MLVARTAERVGGGFRINGEKWFVTLGDVAHFLIVLALVLPERAPTLFLIDKDRPGLRVRRTPRYMHTFVYGRSPGRRTRVSTAGCCAARRRS